MTTFAILHKNQFRNQVSTYEACNRMHTPLHAPKTLRDVQKKACLV